MIKKLLVIGFLLLPSVGYSYLFINTTPLKAKVYLLEPRGDIDLEELDIEADKNSKFTRRLIGETPLKMDMPDKTLLVEIKKDGFNAVTNKIRPTQKSKNIQVVLTPITFAVQFPDIDSNLYVAKEVVGSASGTVLFPYGNYDIRFNKKTLGMDINYKSPYTPYVAFFSTLTILSVGAIITGAIMGDEAFRRTQSAATPQATVTGITETAAWDAVLWSGIGLGSVGLIGTSISGYYEAQERKRIKRFHTLNRYETTLNPLEDYQEILITSSVSPERALPLMDDFVRTYDDNPVIIDVYQKRASIYVQQKDTDRAIRELIKLRKDYPSMDAYERTSKTLGDLHMGRQEYLQAAEAFKESLKVQTIYPESLLRYYMLDNYFRLARQNSRYIELFLKESENTAGLNADQRNAVKEWRLQLEQNTES